MIFEPIEQRSAKWHELRLGKPTASQFSRIISNDTGNIARKPWKGYQGELVAEKIFQRSVVSKDISNYPAVRWGVEHEPAAAAALAERIGPFQPGGFFMDDDKRYGASPDGLIEKGNRREICEIKCPYEVGNHVKNLLYGVEFDYRAQIQGQLLVSKADICHFYSWHPDCPPHYQKVERDDPFIRKLDTLLDEFCRQLEENYQRALAIGGWKL